MPISSNPYRKVVIDTSPLIDALTLELMDREPRWRPTILGLSRLSPYLANDPQKQRYFRSLLGSIETMLITSHVIGEIRSDRHVHPDLHAPYWQGCMNFFEKKNIRERLITLTDLNKNEGLRAVVSSLGPTDAGLMKLANQEECMLLTNDGRLYSWLHTFGKMRIEMAEKLVSQ